MCRSAQKDVYLKELIAEVRAARAKRNVGRTPAPAKPAAIENWALAIFRMAWRFRRRVLVPGAARRYITS